MVDSKASIEQSIMDKIRSKGTLNVNEDVSPDDGRWVSAIQNSTLARWLSLRGESMPIPRLSAEEERGLVRLADEIQTVKAADPAADTLHLEVAIDRLVYDLYGLTEEEDTAIERSLGLIFQTDEEEDAALVRIALEAVNDPENVADKASEEEFYEIMRRWRSEAGD